MKFIWTICQQKVIAGVNKITPDKRGMHPPSNKKTPKDMKLVKYNLKSCNETQLVDNNLFLLI